MTTPALCGHGANYQTIHQQRLTLRVADGGEPWGDAALWLEARWEHVPTVMVLAEHHRMAAAAQYIIAIDSPVGCPLGILGPATRSGCMRL